MTAHIKLKTTISQHITPPKKVIYKITANLSSGLPQTTF